MTVDLTQSHKPESQKSLDKQAKRGASILSLGSNALLTFLKFVVGLLTGAASVLAEAAHSTADLLASALTFVSVR